MFYLTLSEQGVTGESLGLRSANVVLGTLPVRIPTPYFIPPCHLRSKLRRQTLHGLKFLGRMTNPFELE